MESVKQCYKGKLKNNFILLLSPGPAQGKTNSGGFALYWQLQENLPTAQKTEKSVMWQLKIDETKESLRPI